MLCLVVLWGLRGSKVMGTFVFGGFGKPEGAMLGGV